MEKLLTTTTDDMFDSITALFILNTNYSVFALFVC